MSGACSRCGTIDASAVRVGRPRRDATLGVISIWSIVFILLFEVFAFADLASRISCNSYFRLLVILPTQITARIPFRMAKRKRSRKGRVGTKELNGLKRLTELNGENLVATANRTVNAEIAERRRESQRNSARIAKERSEQGKADLRIGDICRRRRKETDSTLTGCFLKNESPYVVSYNILNSPGWRKMEAFSAGLKQRWARLSALGRKFGDVFTLSGQS